MAEGPGEWVRASEQGSGLVETHRTSETLNTRALAGPAFRPHILPFWALLPPHADDLNSPCVRPL